MATTPAAKKTAAPSGMNSAAVNQHKRLAMGLPVDGKSLPSAPTAGKKTPA